MYPLYYYVCIKGLRPGCISLTHKSAHNTPPICTFVSRVGLLEIFILYACSGTEYNSSIDALHHPEDSFDKFINHLLCSKILTKISEFSVFATQPEFGTALIDTIKILSCENYERGDNDHQKDIDSSPYNRVKFLNSSGAGLLLGFSIA